LLILLFGINTNKRIFDTYKYEGMRIEAEMKMVDVIQNNIQLLAVVQRLKIPLGFKERTVQDICREYDVDVTFFL